MSAPKIKIRGIRTPIPSGYVLGRVSSGTGDTVLVHVTTLAEQIAATGIPSAPSGSSGGINQLTGDVAAGPATGSAVATLATVNGSPGSYTYASITVNGKGLVTAAFDGVVVTAPRGMLPLVTGDSPPGLYAIGTPDGQMIG